MSPGILGTNDAGGVGIRAVTDGSAPSVQVTQSGSGEGIHVTSADVGVEVQSFQGDGLDAGDGGTNSTAVLGADTSGGGYGSGVSGFSATGNAGVFTAGLGNSAGALEVYGGTRNQTYAVAEFHDGAGYTRQSFDDSGNLYLSGQLYSTGSCRYGCSKTRGVLTYTQRTAEPTLSDDGEARLANGETHVQLDPAFANVMENQDGVHRDRDAGRSDPRALRGATRRARLHRNVREPATAGVEGTVIACFYPHRRAAFRGSRSASAFVHDGASHAETSPRFRRRKAHPPLDRHAKATSKGGSSAGLSLFLDAGRRARDMLL